MRYFLDPSLEKHKNARREYLYDIFKIFFVELSDCSMTDGLGRGAIVLQSFPATYEANVGIICGHNSFVAHILQQYGLEMPEKELFIITCEHKYRTKYYVKGKKIYLAPQVKGFANQHNGALFGFDFDITDAELNMFNTGNIAPKEKLLSVFNRIY